MIKRSKEWKLEVLKAYRECNSYAAVGRVLGLSGSRVRQIVESAKRIEAYAPSGDAFDELTIGTKNALAAEGYLSVKDICRLKVAASDGSLLRTPNVGKRSHAEICVWLEKYFRDGNVGVTTTTEEKKMDDEKDGILRDLRTIQGLIAENPSVLNESMLRWQLRHRFKNGLAKHTIPVGRKLLISKSGYETWLASQAGLRNGEWKKEQ